MKKIFNFIFLLISITVFSQIDNIKSGEKLSYRLHYGFLNAGTATLTTNQITYKGKPFNVMQYESRGNNYILCEKRDLAAFVDFEINKNRICNFLNNKTTHLKFVNGGDINIDSDIISKPDSFISILKRSL